MMLCSEEEAGGPRGAKPAAETGTKQETGVRMKPTVGREESKASDRRAGKDTGKGQQKKRSSGGLRVDTFTNR